MRRRISFLAFLTIWSIVSAQVDPGIEQHSRTFSTSGTFSNVDLNTKSSSYRLDVVIESHQPEHFIEVSLLKFKNGRVSVQCEPDNQECLNKQTIDNECRDYAMIKLNKENSNGTDDPKFCNSIDRVRSFSTYAPRVLVTIVFDSSSQERSSLPVFKFEYKIRPICNHVYRDAQAVMSFDSTQTRINTTCTNSIMAPSDRQIVLYKVNWLADTNAEETSINVYPYGSVFCRDYDQMNVSRTNPKYSDASGVVNTYCSKNQFKSAKSNASELYYTLSTSWNNSNTPLQIDIGYFTYKSLYEDSDSPMVLNFSEIIPASVSDEVKTNLEFKIRLSDKNKYIFPVISECNTVVDEGSVSLITSQQNIKFIKACQLEKYALFSSMEREITVSFENVRLAELRDKSIGLKIEFASMPHVFNQLEGEFESNNYSFYFVRDSMETLSYEWIIDLDPGYMIRFNIDKLVNSDSIDSLNVYDLANEMNLLDLLDIQDNLNRKRNSYLFASSRIRVTFKFQKRARVDKTARPYIKCSYIGEPRVIDLDSEKSLILHMPASLINTKLDWLIRTTPGHQIIAKIIDFNPDPDRRAQLIFNKLGNAYPNGGMYYYSLVEPEVSEEADVADMHTSVTQMVVSKLNQIRIQFEPGNYNATFTLNVTSYKNVLDSLPYGMIQQHFNEGFGQLVLRLTDQIWNVKMPYGKKPEFLTKQLDLLQETTCSQAWVSFYDSNSTQIEQLCKEDIRNDVDDASRLKPIIRSNSSQTTIEFITQNTPKVVKKEGSVSFYEGFKFFYTIREEPGDCFFYKRSNMMCNYKNIGKENLWTITSNRSEEQYLFNEKSFFCSGCFISASIEASNSFKTATFASPIINSNKKFLRFSYALKSMDESSASRLMVRLVYHKELNQLAEDSGVLLANLTASDWKTVEIKISNHDLLDDYALLFRLESLTARSFAEVSLDNIQLFESDMDSLTPSSLSSVSYCQQTPYSCNFDSFCSPKAACISLSSSAVECLCPPGFTGVKCDVPVDPCQSSQCSPNSKCVAIDSSNYKCVCDANYIGKYCQTRLSPCRNASIPDERKCNSLTGQGECVDDATEQFPHRFKCSCSPDFIGTHCEHRVRNNCLGNTCKLNDPKAECIDLDEGYVCKCSSGFMGLKCNQEEPCGETSPCQNNGKCVKIENNIKCMCQGTGFEGKYCEVSKICSKCDVEGTLFCDSMASSPKCICRSGFEGKTCELRTDPCLIKNCAHGECVTKLDETGTLKAQCLCIEGFKGATCDVKETICDRGTCLNNATCIESRDSPRGFGCKCLPGFTGENCEILEDVCQSQPCLNGGRCISYMGAYSCLCPITNTGRNCESSLDTCRDNMCAHGSTCQPIGDTYICQCPPGAFGRFCDEFQDSCYENDCASGFCVSNDLSTDHYKYKCNCMPGYTGRTCDISLSQCASDPCQNDAKCIDLVDSYKCICKSERYTGKNCETYYNFCSLPSEACHQHKSKQCIETVNGNKCVCLPQFTGPKCEVRIDICEHLKPCRSGQCVTMVNDQGEEDYKCLNCTLGYDGKNCSNIIDYCGSNPCQNGGSCHSEIQNYHCTCKEGWTGKNCHEPLYYQCLNNQCQHDSKCVPKKDQNSYACLCDEDHEGVYCEKKKDKCKDVFCPNGYCVNGQCQCDPTNPLCTINSKCFKKELTCHNGGNCTDIILTSSVVQSKCFCPAGLTGEFCERSIYCDSSSHTFPCGEPNQCKTVGQSYSCNCSAPFIGHGCRRKIDDYAPDFEAYLKEEKLTKIKEGCRFGHSRESISFLVVVIIFVCIFAFIGFIIGHIIVNSYRKRFERKINSRTKLTSPKAVFSPKTSTMFRTPKPSSSRDRILSDVNSFSIPRPSVRMMNPTNV